MITLPHVGPVPAYNEPDFFYRQMTILFRNKPVVILATKIWIIVMEGVKYVKWDQTPDKKSVLPKMRGGLQKFDQVTIHEA